VAIAHTRVASFVVALSPPCTSSQSREHAYYTVWLRLCVALLVLSGRCVAALVASRCSEHSCCRARLRAALLASVHKNRRIAWTSCLTRCMACLSSVATATDVMGGAQPLCSSCGIMTANLYDSSRLCLQDTHQIRDNSKQAALARPRSHRRLPSRALAAPAVLPPMLQPAPPRSWLPPRARPDLAKTTCRADRDRRRR
jgi:hypothetical protein